MREFRATDWSNHVLSDAEREELKGWRARQAFGVLLLVAATAIVAWGLYEMVTDFDEFFRSPWPVFALVAIFWVSLFVKSIRLWWRAGQDLKTGQVETLTALARLREIRAPGVFATMRSKLLVGSHRFDIRTDHADRLIEGHPVEVRFAATSLALLSAEMVDREVQFERAVDGVLIEPLTRREEDLLRLIAQGLSDKEMARELNLSPATVRTYNSTLFGKLGVERRTQAIPFAHQLGLMKSGT